MARACFCVSYLVDGTISVLSPRPPIVAISRDKSHLPVRNPSKSSERVLDGGRERERRMLLIKAHGDCGGSGRMVVKPEVCFAAKLRGSCRLLLAVH